MLHASPRCLDSIQLIRECFQVCFGFKPENLARAKHEFLLTFFKVPWKDDLVQVNWGILIQTATCLRQVAERCERTSDGA